MSKLMRMTEEYIEEIQDEFHNILSNTNLLDGKFSYEKELGLLDKKATLYFTSKAWLKMNKLVSDFDSEIGWHGVARRGGENEYIIDDILVYPQIVGPANIEPDQEEYQMWLMEQPDEVFNNIRMQGHSHVNMECLPSQTDLAFYRSIFSQLEGDMFYVFMIWNKKGERWIKIYDSMENVVFYNEDITIENYEFHEEIKSFMKSAKGKVKSTPLPKTKTTGNPEFRTTYIPRVRRADARFDYTGKEFLGAR